MKSKKLDFELPTENPKQVDFPLESLDIDVNHKLPYQPCQRKKEFTTLLHGYKDICAYVLCLYFMCVIERGRERERVYYHCQFKFSHYLI